MTDDSFHVYDTTLRDGAQREGLALTVEDKLKIARQLDALGVGFVEGGWPGANPKDAEFFRRAQTELTMSTAKLAAFGATRKPGIRAADDPQVAFLRESGAPVVTLVGKSWDLHVTDALRTTLEENLEMVRDTITHLRAEGQRVFFDAEHFFDGYRSNAAYAVEVVRVAAEAGADVVALCDTNGGMMPGPLAEVVAALTSTEARIGIHCHNDTACAVANTLAAVEAGATHVQGTANGYGERCGNADLFSVIAGLELKMGRRVLPHGRLRELVPVSHAIAEVANIAPDPHASYVGLSAFAHKAGLHVSAIKVAPEMYQHIDPLDVGNDMRLLVSELAGRATIVMKGKEMGLELGERPDTVLRVIDRVKELESVGYTFEAADASFELLLREEMGEPSTFFELESWRTIVERRPGGEVISEATVKLRAKGERIVATGEGNGPVNALDNALRSALEQLYPTLANLSLVDFKVRIVEGGGGTGAVTRVLVETTDGVTEWDTIGVDQNIIAASWQALQDAVTYGLLRQGESPV
jgi:2-isopropylmalate synthase